MSITVTEEDVSRAEFDAMFEYAQSRSQHEVVRVGSSDALKEVLWNDFAENRTAVIRKNDFVVGYYCFNLISEQPVMRFFCPCFGPDAEGSRSWYRSEEYQQATADFLRSLDCDSMVIAMREGSPVYRATMESFGAFDRHMEVPETTVIPGLRRYTPDMIKVVLRVKD